MRGATTSIAFESCTDWSGAIGQQFAAALADAARRGVWSQSAGARQPTHAATTPCAVLPCNRIIITAAAATRQAAPAANSAGL